MVKKAIIITVLETSDHCGYCSGNENIYSRELLEITIDLPKYYEDHKIGDLDIKEYNWSKELDSPISCCSKSYYCKICDESINNDLGKHDYRYTIKCVEIINIL